MLPIIKDLQTKVSKSENWEKCIVDFIGLWTEKEEFYRGYKYNYLIDEEALDWLTLTERLVSSIKAQIPKSTYYYSSCTGLLPSIETYHYMKNSLPKLKLSQMRNYYYGVIIENFIYHYKLQEYEKNSLFYANYENEFYKEIYGKSLSTLIAKFYTEEKISKKDKLNFYELKKFSYWLFKYRINNTDNTKMAHETNMAINKAKSTLNEKIIYLFE